MSAAEGFRDAPIRPQYWCHSCGERWELQAPRPTTCPRCGSSWPVEWVNYEDWRREHSSAS